MPVAPSFSAYKTVSEPYQKDNSSKYYIKVEHPNTHNIREVRFYSEKEFAKLYPSKNEKINSGFMGLKAARGFTNGPIFIIRGTHESDVPELDMSVARLASDIGWYVTFDDRWDIPTDWHQRFDIIPLTWDEFRDNDDYHSKTAAQLEKIISNKRKELKDLAPKY